MSEAPQRGATAIAAAPLLWARVAGERIAYRLAAPDAPGPFVIGVHGLGSSHEDLLEVLEVAGLPALALDLPGFGRSARPDRAYPVRAAAEAALAVLEAHGVERAIWVGCSYGGHVALRAALDWPERVAALVLCASGGLAPTPAAPAVVAAYAEERLAGRALSEVERALDLLVVRPTEATARFRAARLAAHASGSEAAAYRAIARSAEGVADDDAGARLFAVSAPTWLVHGALDPVVPIALARAAATRVPCATLVELAGVGHLPWLEAPDAVARAVRVAAAPERNLQPVRTAP